MHKALVPGVLAALLLSSTVSSAVEERTISPLQVSFNTIKLDRKKAVELGKFDAIVIDRFGFEKVQSNTWAFIKSNGDTANKKPLIFIYQLGPMIRDDTDKMSPYWLNNIGRFKNDRGVTGDALAVSNPDWLLKGNLGSHLKISANEFFLDFGSSAVRSYWNRVTQSDIIDQKWKADGIFQDVCSAFYFTAPDKVKGDFPAKYADAQSWDTAMNGYLSDTAGFLRQKGQLSMPNRSYSQTQTGYAAWLALDKLPNPPDYAMEEGAFVTSYGPVGDAQYYQVAEWERQANLQTQLKHTKVVYLAHTHLGIGQSGLSSAATPITFQQVFGFALGSYLVAQPENGPKPLFSFDYDRRRTAGYTLVTYSPVYEQLDLGKPLGTLQKQQSGAATVYSKRFDRGIVFVNPTSKTSAAVQAPTGMQTATPDFEKGLVLGKLNESITLPPFSSVVFVQPSVPAPPVLRVGNN